MGVMGLEDRARTPSMKRLRDRLSATIENLLFARVALTAHKLRSFLTILGIVIGVTTVIAMVSIIQGFHNNITENFQAFGATLVQFQKFDVRFGPGGNRDEEQRLRKNLTYDDAIALKRLVPSMLAVSPERYWFSGRFSEPVPDVIYEGNQGTPDTIVGVTEDYPAANNHFIGEGRFIGSFDVLHATGVVVLGSSIAEALFPHRDPIAREVTISGRRYQVVGVMEEQGDSGFESSDSHVYLPLSTFDSDFPWIKQENGVNIATIPRNAKDVEKITEEGTAVLRMRRKVPFNKPNDFGIVRPDKLIGNFRQITGGITLAIVFIASIALLVGGVGVMNIMLVSVTERTREIGVRKALGAVRRDIVLQFLTEAMALSFIGGAAGVGLGLLIATVVSMATPLRADVPLWSVLAGLGVSISIGLFFGIYPAYKAAKLDPIEALRYE